MSIYRRKVSRELLVQFVRDLGFEADEVADVKIDNRRIYVTEFHQHPEDGGRYCVEGSYGVATVLHTLYFDDDEEGD